MTDRVVVGRAVTLFGMILDATLVSLFLDSSCSFSCSLPDAVARVELLPDHPFLILKLSPVDTFDPFDHLTHSALSTLSTLSSSIMPQLPFLHPFPIFKLPKLL